MEAERRLQPSFTFVQHLQIFVLVVTVFAARYVFAHLPNRWEMGPKVSTLVLSPVDLGASGFRPLHLAGAWRATSDDKRFGGLSGLALDRGKLIALTDGGSIAVFEKPEARPTSVAVKELPDGPESKSFRIFRDSEAITRDRRGRGWWVSFEHTNEIWLYDRTLSRALAHVGFGEKIWSPNAGIEGLATSGDSLLLFVEKGRKLFRLRGSTAMSLDATGKKWPFSEAARLPDGRLLAIERGLTLFGFRNALVFLEESADRIRIRRRIALPVGAMDNIEGMAAEARPDGSTRLWLVTDDNFQRPLRTLLLALDLPPKL